MFIGRLPLQFSSCLILILVACASCNSSLHAQTYGSASIEEFLDRVEVAAASDVTGRQSKLKIPQIPKGFQPWWQKVTDKRLQPGTNATKIDLDSLIVQTLEYSSQVKVFSDLPFIRQTAIVEADSAFDWNAFVNTRWDDLSDPVGNVLTTGGSPRFRDNHLTGSFGLRKKTVTGGYVDVAQEVGFQNNNSNFFQPQDQATSRIKLGFTQPLMRGRGKVYNTSLIVLAEIDTDVAEDEFSRQLQSHLLEVTRAYWSLYLERVTLIQKQQLYLRAEKIYKDLKARSDIDVVGSQLVRVEAAVTQRKSDLIRAEMAVRNAQDRIQALVNDPQLARTVKLEMIPTNTPVRESINLDVREIISTALQSRPEINQSLKQMKAACVRLNMSRNELLPQLDLILESYVAGLRGESNFGNAWTDQFSTGEPGYSVGLRYEFPLCNRAARARFQRRRLELRQLENQFRTTVETLLLETKVAAREVVTAEREIRARYFAMQSAAKRLENIEERWSHLPGKEKSIGLYLDDLLATQVLLFESEFEYAKAETTYNLALMNLKRATGTLLQQENIQSGIIEYDGLPTLILEKVGSQPYPSKMEYSVPQILDDPADGNKSSFIDQNRSLQQPIAQPTSQRMTPPTRQTRPVPSGGAGTKRYFDSTATGNVPSQPADWQPRQYQPQR